MKFRARPFASAEAWHAITVGDTKIGRKLNRLAGKTINISSRAAFAVGLALMPGVASATDMAIVGAKVYTAPDAVAIADAVVLVRGDLVVAVGPRNKMPVPAGFTVLTATVRS